MKDDKRIANTKLGIVVIASLIFLVFALYMIGKNQNIFGRSFTVIAEVKDVNGLVPGNNVRFQGMDVGTVKSIEMLDDQSIHVSLLIRNTMQTFIKKNALTSINTDGLMGNKILQIIPQEGVSETIEEGDTLQVLEQVGTDEMLAKLNTTGDYLQRTLLNLAEMTEKLNQNEVVWKLLSDTVIVTDLRAAIMELRIAGANAAGMAKAGKDLIIELEQGEGLINNLFTDTLMNDNLEKSLEHLEQTSSDAAKMMVSIKTLVQNIQKGEGTAGLILNDSAFRKQLVQTLGNVESSTYKLNENMEALKSNFLFRKYYKNQEKARIKAEKQNN